MHDIFEVGLPPHARIIPITDPRDRVGTPYIPCPKEKIAAIVLTDLHDQPQQFKPFSDSTAKIGENVVKFLLGEVEAGRLPESIGPIQSGVGSVGNAVLSGLAKSGLRHLMTIQPCFLEGLAWVKAKHKGIEVFWNETEVKIKSNLCGKLILGNQELPFDKGEYSFSVI